MATLLNAPVAPEGAQDFPSLKEQLGKVVIFAPMEERTIDTERGPAEVTQCVCLVWNEVTKKVEELGTITVFWKAVRAQLHEAVGTDAYVVGRLMMTGKRFVLREVDEATRAAIQADLF